MPMQSVILRPGVDVERTPALNEAGISRSQLIRTKSGLTQAVGGWEQFSISTVPSTARALHGWQDIAGRDYLAIGATANLAYATATSYSDISPLTQTTNPTPDFSISSGSNIVTVVDPNSNVGVFDSVFFNTPIAIGNLLFQGGYPISTVLSTGSYTFLSSIDASTTIASSGTLPTFETFPGSALVNVTILNNTIQAITGLQVSFYAPTTVDALTIQGPYTVVSVASSLSTFVIGTPNQATSSDLATMNASLAQLVYYQTQGPPPAGTGWGAGGWGLGAWGVGSTSATVISTLATAVTTTDWSLDNWGEVLLAAPKDGAIYQWAPDGGFLNARVISEAPFHNGGIFISMPQQILVAWKSEHDNGTQDNLIVRWSDQVDFANWEVSNATTAGSFRIPTGSVIVGGLQAPNYGVIWTDLDVWIMQYIGGTLVFNFTRAGSGCGLIGQGAAGVIAGEVYWCGKSNFFKLGANGVEIVPCSVWDFIFQNLNSTNSYKIRCAPNSSFNEISWFFPSTSSTENDSYVKFNLVDGTWDYGILSRTAWTDISVVGNAFGVDSGGFINQHEVGNTINGATNPSFQTGWWTIADGNELAFVDFVMPDFVWGTYGTATTSLNITFYSVDYPGDTPRAYGPYTVTQATEYITPRIRGRLMSMLVQSATNNGFWRIGRVRYRWAPAGRR